MISVEEYGKMLPINIELEEGYLEDETRDGYLVKASQKKLWACLLDLLIQFDTVCKKNNLRYYIDSGTLLGAIRHKGFIPWDDDIDVVMPREDYDKLMSLPADAFGEPYFFQNYKTDSYFTHINPQLRNSNTCAILKTEGKGYHFNQGIFLDIFPLDTVSKYKVFRKAQYLMLKFTHKLYEFAAYKKTNGNAIKRFFANCIYVAFHKHGFKKLCGLFDFIAAHPIMPGNRLAPVTFATIASFDVMDKKAFPKNYYNDTELVEFEKHMFPAPKKWDKVLRKMYGDEYMTPVNAASAHGQMHFDPERSYKEFV